MKKGLRRRRKACLLPSYDSNRRPDEEGIKTLSLIPAPRLRRDSNRRPDEEGIKTPRENSRSLSLVIPTADLMKKGLRQWRKEMRKRKEDSNRRPDEEGIKTYPNGVRFEGE